MELASWKKVIAANGGNDHIAKLIFDNSRVFTRNPKLKFADEVVIDETNGCWIMHRATQAFARAGVQDIGTTMVEDNTSLQAIEFVDSVDNLRYVDNTY